MFCTWDVCNLLSPKIVCHSSLLFDSDYETKDSWMPLRLETSMDLNDRRVLFRILDDSFIMRVSIYVRQIDGSQVN